MAAGDGGEEREGRQAVDAHGFVGRGGGDEGEGGVGGRHPGARAAGWGEGCEGVEEGRRRRRRRRRGGVVIGGGHGGLRFVFGF